MTGKDNGGTNVDSTLYHLTNLADGRSHVPYLRERELLGYVERGERNRALACFESIMGAGPEADIGTLAGSRAKHAEYVAVAHVTVLCRTAIRGGVDPSLAYDRSDIYLQRIAEGSGEREWRQIMRDSLADTCDLISSWQRRQMDPRHVRACRQYVYDHLDEKITVAGVAEALGINTTYLSGLFHACEGITLKEFIQREKTSAACKLLEHTHDSVASIAEQLSFCSASHFCRVFKKHKGLSPNAYRNRLSCRQATP